MSILIIAVARSGSSRLLQAVSHAYGKEGIFEPTTPGCLADFNPSTDIVKTAVETLPLADHLKLIRQFDKTILLDRKDRLAQAISYLNLQTHMKGNYDSKYVSKDFTQDQINRSLSRLEDTREQLEDISKALSLPIVYLEDLVALKEIGVKYSKSFFAPELKLRQEKKQLF